jgi:hypothetical protein
MPEVFLFFLSLLETRFLHIVSFGNNLDIQAPFDFFHISGWHFMQSPTSGEQQSILIFYIEILGVSPR